MLQCKGLACRLLHSTHMPTFSASTRSCPHQALESEEAAAARQQRVSAALKEYRKTLGLDVDPAVEAQAQASDVA